MQSRTCGDVRETEGLEGSTRGLDKKSDDLRECPEARCKLEFASRTARADQDVTRKSAGVGQDKSGTAGDGQDLTRESRGELMMTRS